MRESRPRRPTVLEREFAIERPLDQVFEVLSDPIYVAELSPPDMRMRVNRLSTDQPQLATEIDATLRVRGLPVRWRSELTVWDPPHALCEEQRIGPFRLWRLERLFTDESGSTLVTERLTYAVLGGSVLDRLLVRHDLERFLDFRAERLSQVFTDPALF